MTESLLDLALMGAVGGTSIVPVTSLPSDPSATPGMVALAPRWPLVGSLPGTVVNGQRLRIAGGGTYGTEYLGVGGSWVSQPSVTMAAWQSKIVGNFISGSSRIVADASIIGYKKSFSLEWMQYISSAIANEVIIKNGYPSSVGTTMLIQRSASSNDMSIGLYGIGADVFSNVLSFVDWTKLRVDYDFSTKTLSIYINDLFFISGVTGQSPANDGNQFVIDGSGGESFAGKIAYVKASCSGDSLVWDMSKLEPNEIHDESGNGHNGAVVEVTAEYSWVPL